MHVMYGYVEIYDITAATGKDFEIIAKKVFKDIFYILSASGSWWQWLVSSMPFSISLSSTSYSLE